MWKHGGAKNLITMRVPREAKDLIYRIGVLIDNQVIGDINYNKEEVLKQIEKILP